MNARSIRLAAVLLVLFGALGCPAIAQELTPGDYFWYVPEHEKYGRTAFYSRPSFQSSMVRVTRTQRAKLVGARKGWAMIEFDVAGKAYIHIRLLKYLAYNPSANDPWHEFQRASVFTEEPKKVEARLKGTTAPTSSTTESKTPAWKRYKDSWGVKTGRATRPGGADESTAESTQPETGSVPKSSTAKTRNSKYPLLTPIGSEPQEETATAQPAEADSGR